MFSLHLRQKPQCCRHLGLDVQRGRLDLGKCRGTSAVHHRVGLWQSLPDRCGRKISTSGGLEEQLGFAGVGLKLWHLVVTGRCFMTFHNDIGNGKSSQLLLTPSFFRWVGWNHQPVLSSDHSSTWWKRRRWMSEELLGNKKIIGEHHLIENSRWIHAMNHAMIMFDHGWQIRKS